MSKSRYFDNAVGSSELSVGMKLATGTSVFSYELKLISILRDMTLETPMYALLTQLLDIPNYRVISAEIETDKITLDVESASQTATCPHCGKTSKTLHERHPRIVRDLPISGKPTYLRFVRRRFFCDDCRRAFSESLDFVDERRDYTRRYQHWIFLQVRENNISTVHRAEELTYTPHRLILRLSSGQQSLIMWINCVCGFNIAFLVFDEEIL